MFLCAQAHLVEQRVGGRAEEQQPARDDCVDGPVDLAVWRRAGHSQQSVEPLLIGASEDSQSQMQLDL